MRRLSSFPVNLNVAERPVIVAGGGEAAAAKLRLVLLTQARPRVIAPEIETEMSVLIAEHGVAHLARLVEPEDLAGAALVFAATGDEAEDARVAGLARAARVPVNVVDRPQFCDFITPAIVERAPLTVAISTEGAAPVLARLVRARIEAMLSPRLGSLVAAAGAFRDTVASRLGNGIARRRFWEKLFDKAILGEGAGDASRFRREAIALLDEAGCAAPAIGTVFLVGAGPGAADLLTLRAQRVLQAADVIVHDALVPEEVISQGRRDAERISVGKRKGHGVRQEEINDLLVGLARDGKRVARLKAGDPMVYGRAGEEIAALEAAGVPYQIVPGVTAALAAAAETATPVTHRARASTLVFATGHGADGGDPVAWAEVARSGATLALYMGRSVAGEIAAKLAAAGLPWSIPVGAIENASRADSRAFVGTLADLAAFSERRDVSGPVVILVGEAVAAGRWGAAEPLAPRLSRAA